MTVWLVKVIRKWGNIEVMVTSCGSWKFGVGILELGWLNGADKRKGGDVGQG